MAIARKKQSPASSKPSKSPASIAEDPGALATIKTPKKKATKSAEKDRAKAEKAEAQEKKPGKLEKLIMTAVPETEAVLMADHSETPKKQSKGSQKGGKIQPPPMVKNGGKSPNGKDKGKTLSDSAVAAFQALEEYAGEMVKKSRYAKTDPKKLALGIFFVLPECEDLTQGQFAEYFKLGINTVTRWKLDKDVIKVRNEFSEIHYKQYTPKIINHLIKGAQKTSWVNGLVDVAAIKLFLQYVEKWNEKQEIDHTSGGAPITWGVAPSQFIKKDAIPEAEEESEEDPDD